MKSFSPAGMTVKGYYGLGARTFGNPDGALTGGGAYAAGGDNPNGPNQGGGGSSSVIDLPITQDLIDTGGTNGGGLVLSEVLTPQQMTDWLSGVITTLNVSATGNPPNGYWVITGGTPPSDPIVGLPGTSGFVVDLFAGSPVTINMDTSRLRIFGAGGGGGGSDGNLFGGAGNGGSAILLSGGGTVDLNISNTVGANTGRIFGAGGGGGAGPGNGGDPNFPCGGGGGAGGWFGGPGGVGTGGTAHADGNDGGIYDPANGGSGDPDVTGGDGGQIGGTGGGAGGALGVNGSGGSGGPGTGGFAVRRTGGTLGATVILSGGGTNFVRGTVQ